MHALFTHRVIPLQTTKCTSRPKLEREYAWKLILRATYVECVYQAALHYHQKIRISFLATLVTVRYSDRLARGGGVDRCDPSPDLNLPGGSTVAMPGKSRCFPRSAARPLERRLRGRRVSFTAGGAVRAQACCDWPVDWSGGGKRRAWGVGPRGRRQRERVGEELPG